jgi:hypothetical protein
MRRRAVSVGVWRRVALPPPSRGIERHRAAPAERLTLAGLLQAAVFPGTVVAGVAFRGCDQFERGLGEEATNLNDLAKRCGC